MADNYFKELYNTPVKDRVEKKNGLNYLRWAAAWAEIKKHDPQASYKVFTQDIAVLEEREGVQTSYTVERPWFTDSINGTGWVKVSVTVNGISHEEILPIMNLKNQPVPAGDIKSTEANKSIQRAITKACARHGIGLILYEAEVEVEEARLVNKLQQDCMELISKKAALSENTRRKVGEICKAALPNENGNPKLCEDNEKLENLRKKLLAIRKISD